MKKENAILVSLEPVERGAKGNQDLFTELEQIALSAGACVAGHLTQQRETPDCATYIGKGKTLELKDLAARHSADLVIVNDVLKPSQQRNLEEILGIKVIDRPGLILDLFAQRAKSREGKVQVELAQLNYLLPRLSGKGIMLSRLGGGIGTRGPGETKLETDRRRIKQRISFLRQDLVKIKATREQFKKKRKMNSLPVFALVGYTNSGKTMLLNTLTNAQKLTDNRPFSTLDTTTRRIKIGPGKSRPILISDTVGFIKDLPVELVAAFKTTLEELLDADVLIHVVDSSDPHKEEQIKTVRQILSEIGVTDKPILLVFNKIDRISSIKSLSLLAPRETDVIYCSALTGKNISKLFNYLTEYTIAQTSAKLMIPYNQAALVSLLHEQCRIISKKYTDKFVNIKAVIPINLINKFNEYIDRS